MDEHEWLDPREEEEIEAGIEVGEAMMEVLDEMIQAGVVRYDPGTGKYRALMGREEGQRRLEEFRRNR